MSSEYPVRDFYGKTIGYIETKSNGDKIVRDFYRRILGRYDKASDTTRDFYGRVVARGEVLGMFLPGK